MIFVKIRLIGKIISFQQEKLQLQNMKSNQEKSGTIRCQRCLKYGHYTYECQNEVAYRYRPSRTVMFKQQMKLALNKDKGPQTVIKNPDYQRRVIQDRPSSSDQQDQQQNKVEQKNIVNLQQMAKKVQIQQKVIQNAQQQEGDSSSSSSSSSQSSSSSSSSSSSDQQDSDQDSGPHKKRKQ